MKSMIKNIAAITMIFLITASSSYIDFNKMVCLITGKVVYSTEEIEDCLPKNDNTSFTQKCCDFYTIILDFNYQSVVNHDKTILDWTSFSIISTVFEIYVPTISEIFVFTFSDSSPPFISSGIQKLIQIQIFRL